MKKVKLLLSLFLTLAAVMVVCVFGAAAEPGDSIATAEPVEFGYEYEENISENGEEDYYSIYLSKSGKVDIKFTSFIEYYAIVIYDVDGKEIWYSDYNEWISTTGMRKDTHIIYLEAGQYYINIYGNYGSTGDYKFQLNYKSAGANIAEPNNNISQAKSVSFNKTIKGLIAQNDPEDYYKISLSSSGRLQLNITSYMQYYCIVIYNADGEEVWYTDDNEWISTTQKRSDKYYIDLEKGYYYFKVNGYMYGSSYASTGFYNYSLSFIPSNANIAEPNNNINEAKVISFNKKIIGQIACNDREDYYKLTVTSSGKYFIDFTSYMQYYCIVIYDVNGKEIWCTDCNEWISTTGKRTDRHELDLSKGTYYLKVNGYLYGSSYASTGTYTFTVTPNITVSKISSIKASSTTDTVTLSWSKVNNASGYQVYRYIVSEKRYKKILTTKDTKCTINSKITKLIPGTTYTFRVRAYRKVGDMVYYGAVKEIIVSTRPTAPTLKVAAGSKKATLAWNKQSGATGYVVYMATSKNGKYSRIAVVKGNSNVKYTKKGLTSGKAYYFKVYAYRTVNSQNYYSVASPVVGVKIK